MGHHDDLIRDHLRPLQGYTGTAVSAVMSMLDKVDPHREVLQGSDMRVRNQLENDLKTLQSNIILTVRKLNETRDEVLEGFFGTDHYCHLGFDKIADSGQTYCFVPSGQIGLPSMITPLEHRDNQLPLYQRRPVDQTQAPQEAGLPNYNELYPHNSLEEFRPFHRGNEDAISEGLSSGSSDYQGKEIAQTELLQRMIEKLEAEFENLEKAELTRDKLVAFQFGVFQQSDHGKVFFTSVKERRARRQQLRVQMKSLMALYQEERQMNGLQQKVVNLRSQVMNGNSRHTAQLVESRTELACLLQNVYTNRVNHSLSELLLPLNATDHSKAHSLSLLPSTHRSIFAPKVAGFPSCVKDQLGRDDSPWVTFQMSPVVDPDDNDDTDENGKVKISQTPENIQTQPKKNSDLIPVEKLKPYAVEHDKESPKVRMIRVPRQGLVFQLLTPADSSLGSTHTNPPDADPNLQAVPTVMIPLVRLAESIRGQGSTVGVELPPDVTTALREGSRVRFSFDTTPLWDDHELARIYHNVLSWPAIDDNALESMVRIVRRLDGRVMDFSRTGLSALRNLLLGYEFPETTEALGLLTADDVEMADAADGRRPEPEVATGR